MRDAANEMKAIPIAPAHMPLQHHGRNSRATTTSESDRIAELEFENARLQRLVAELVLKNQKLRDCE